ncbi:MAG: patatin-like phospholipase family protein [Myxococcales bacterium]|jgi:NTE family protein|nr:patatin-like phospholipase family protein [Myxococcales bacterium]
MPTLAEYLTSHPFELVLSSGFFGFFAHTGVVLALEEAGLRPQLLGGSSAGALVAGLWGAGLPATDLRSELLSLSRASFWDVDPLWGLPFYLREGKLRQLAELLGVGRLADESSGPGLLRGQAFDYLVRGMLERVGVEEFIDCPTKIRVAAFDLGTLRTEVLEDGDLALAIRASCCFPGMFQPVRIGDRRYLDGGIADRPGISTATPGARLLFHHLPAHSPWRKVVRLQNDVPAWPELHLLHEPSLPKLSPFRLTPGPQALQLAYEMTKRRLSEPVSR